MSLWTRLGEAANWLTGRGRAGEAPERSQAFAMGIVALSAKMAAADGAVTDDEVDAFSRVVRVAPGEHGQVMRLFNLAQQSVAGFESYAKKIASRFRDRPGVLEDLLDGLFEIAKADGAFHEGENIFLKEVAAIFGLSDGEYRRLRESHVGPDAADPYSVLGIEPDCSDEDVKRAWRARVREDHPDAMAARGIPPEFLGVAEQKIAAINAAYEKIRRERRFP